MAETIRGVIERVVDGDTVEMRFSDGSRRVRLWGIDAPESDQPYGPTATAGTRAIAEGKVANVHVKDVDPYGRIVGILHVPRDEAMPLDVGRSLVLSGLAWHDQRHAAGADQLRAAEQKARRTGRGLWGQDDPVPPWQWRERSASTSTGASTGTGEVGWGAVLFVIAVVLLVLLIRLAVE